MSSQQLGKDEKYQNNQNTIKIQENDLLFILNEEEKTASIIDNIHVTGDILIQESINYENQEFKITSILQNSFQYSQIVSINFSPKSQLKIIEREAFASSSLKEIVIPASVAELKEGWCAKTSKLNSVKVMPNNKYYKNYEENEEIIIGKSDINKDTYDDLVFASRDITNISLPPNIKRILPYSLSETSITEIFIPSQVTQICEKAFQSSRLEHLKISPDSMLQFIGNKVFENSRIEDISIPSSISELEVGWCCGTTFLANVEIIVTQKQNISCLDDKLIVGKNDINRDEYDVFFFACRDIQTIEIPPNIKRIAPYAFMGSSITEISIPSNVTEIGECAFGLCEDLGIINIPSDSKLQIIGKDAFLSTSIESIFIPPNVTSISDSVFSSCLELTHVDIPQDSKLLIIGKGAFSISALESIFIPRHVKRICEDAFSECEQLEHVEITPDSELQIIEREAFASSSLKEIFIPASVAELKEGWCAKTSKLNSVKVMPNNKYYKNYEENEEIIIGKSDINKDTYDDLVFASRNITNISLPPNIKRILPYSLSETSLTEIFIPAQVTHICKNAFCSCKNIRRVEFPSNSELVTIKKYSFSMSSIESIFIPSHVKKISKGAFYYCKNLHSVEFPPDSELETIKYQSFEGTLIESIAIPSKVSDLQKGWCLGLKNVTIMPDNKYFKNYEQNKKIVVGKSDITKEDYDDLVFAHCDIRNVDIPPNIRRISSFAFSSSKIEKVSIPSHVVSICDNAFYLCRKLRRVEIPPNSELLTVGHNAFTGTPIESIFIPSCTTQFDYFALTSCYRLQIIQIGYNIDPKLIKNKIFLNQDRVIFMIPI